METGTFQGLGFDGFLLYIYFCQFKLISLNLLLLFVLLIVCSFLLLHFKVAQMEMVAFETLGLANLSAYLYDTFLPSSFISNDDSKFAKPRARVTCHSIFNSNRKWAKMNTCLLVCKKMYKQLESYSCAYELIRGISRTASEK